jgi:hypothetical protein
MTQGRVFISYNSVDRETAQGIATALEGRGWQPFFSPWTLQPGVYWIPELDEAIHAAAAFVLLLSSSGPGAWQLLEYYAALEHKAHEPEFRILPVVLGDKPARLPFLQLLQLLHIRDASRAGEHVVGALEAATPTPREPSRFINPYKGLLSLEEGDADYFHGREGVISAVLGSIRRGARFPILLGNSGVGKSSIVQAGVVAALRRRRMPDASEAWPHDLAHSRTWLFVTFRPAKDAFEALARAFVSLWTQSGSTEREASARDWTRDLRQTRSVAGLVRAALEKISETRPHAPPRRVVIVIDQGEELFTKQSPGDAEAFSSLLGAAVREDNLLLLGSFRSDQYGALQTATELFRVVQCIDVSPLDEQELRRVIEKPAQTLGVSFETPELPAQLAREVAREAGALPLLSYLLEDTWKSMQRRAEIPPTLRWKDLRGAHDESVASILSRRAEDYFATLSSDDDRTALEDLFALRLLDVTPLGAALRARVARSECSQLEWNHVQALAGADWRLIVTSSDGQGATAELAHDVLARLSWPRLNGWVSKHAELMEWRARFRVRLLEWEKAQQKAEWLSGASLTEARAMLARYGAKLAPHEQAYIVASRRRTRRGPLVGASSIALLAVGYAAFVLTHAAWHKVETLAEAGPLNRLHTIHELLGFGAVRVEHDISRSFEKSGAEPSEVALWDLQGRRKQRIAWAGGDNGVIANASKGLVLLNCAAGPSKPYVGAVSHFRSGAIEALDFVVNPSEIEISSEDIVLVQLPDRLSDPRVSQIEVHSLRSHEKLGSVGPIESSFAWQRWLTDDGRHLIQAVSSTENRVFDVRDGKVIGQLSEFVVGLDARSHLLTLTWAETLTLRRWSVDDLRRPLLEHTFEMKDMMDGAVAAALSADRAPRVFFSADRRRFLLVLPTVDEDTTPGHPVVAFSTEDLSIIDHFSVENPSMLDAEEPVAVWSNEAGAWIWPLSHSKIRLGSFELSNRDAVVVSLDRSRLALFREHEVEIFDLSPPASASAVAQARSLARARYSHPLGSWLQPRPTLDGSAAVFWETRDKAFLLDLDAGRIVGEAISADQDAAFSYDSRRRELIIWSSWGEVARYRRGYAPFGIFVPEACTFCQRPPAPEITPQPCPAPRTAP